MNVRHRRARGMSRGPLLLRGARPWWQVALATALVAMPVAQARDALHWQAEDGSQLTASYRWLSTTHLVAGEGDIQGRRTDLAAQWDSGRGLVAGLHHEYNALDINAAAATPITNGDLHTLSGAISRDYEVRGGTLRLALAPALSASSNAISDPGELNGDSVQLWASAIAMLPATRGEWVLGAARDHRFGDATVYPVAGWRWRSGPWRVRLVYPDLLLQRKLGGEWSLRFGVSPDGNEWQAFDDKLARDEAFVREAWRAELRLSRRWGQRLETALSAAWFWQQHWDYVARDGERLGVDSEDSHAFGLHLRWRLGGTIMK